MLRERAPSGVVAEVRSACAIDPPAQSLWLVVPGSVARRIYRLGEDSEWAEQLVWSSDSKRVALLVSGCRAYVFNAPTGTLEATVQLTPIDGAPTSRQVRSLRFSDDGDRLQFRSCRRGAAECGDWSEASINLS